MRPSKEYISRIARYIPMRVKSADHLKEQIFKDKTKQIITHPIMFAAGPNTIKGETNIQSQLGKLQEGNLLPTDIPANRGLVNPFRSLVATDAQKLDMLNFHQIGKDNFETRIKAYVLKSPSTTVPQRRKRLKTFAVKCNTTKQKVNSLQKEMKRRTYASLKPEVIGERYIELHRALCDEDSPLNDKKV